MPRQRRSLPAPSTRTANSAHWHDGELAKHVYTTQTAAGDLVANILLAHCYDPRLGRVMADEPKALQFYQLVVGDGGMEPEVLEEELRRRYAEEGDVDALYNLGQLYLHGRLLPWSAAREEMGADLVRRAHEEGHTRATGHLAYLHFYGKGGQVLNQQRAVELYTEAASRGLPGSLSNLGHCFLQGCGALRDEDQAVSLYLQGVERGDASAMNGLGTCYQFGKGVTKDVSRAKELYLQGVSVVGMGGGGGGAAVVAVFHDNRLPF